MVEKPAGVDTGGRHPEVVVAGGKRELGEARPRPSKQPRLVKIACASDFPGIGSPVAPLVLELTLTEITAALHTWRGVVLLRVFIEEPCQGLLNSPGQGRPGAWTTAKGLGDKA